MLLLASSIYFNYKWSQHQLLKQTLVEESGVYDVSIQPDTIRVDGNLVQMQGIYRHSDSGFREKIQLYYIVKDQAEKFFWQNQVTPLFLLVEAEVNLPETQRNLNGFDYREYLYRKQIYRLFQVNNMQVIDGQKKSEDLFLLANIAILRRKMEVHLNQIFPKLTSVYIKSLLLGIKDADFRLQQSDWQKNGILHLFSLSGMHVFFFLWLIRYLLLRSGLIVEGVLAVELLFLLFLFFFTGLSTSVGRCVLQTGFSRMNRFFRWSYSDLDCWSIALACNLLWHPTVLLEASGQLTYGLTFFLLFLSPLLTTIQFPMLRSLIFNSSLGLITLPFLWFHFHEWYGLSFLFSWLLVPLFTYLILPVCFLLFLSSFILPIEWLSFISSSFEFFLGKFHLLLNTTGQIKQLHFVTGKISVLVFVCALSILLFLLHLWAQQKIKILHIWLLVLFFSFSLVKYTQSEGMIAFVDIGQGDAIFIQLPFHQGNLLIDTGGRLSLPQEDWQKRTYQDSNADRTLLPFLKSRGVKQLDKVLITHADADHMGDLQRVSEEIIIKELYFPKGTAKKASFANIVQQLQSQGTTIHQVLAREKIFLKKQCFYVLFPQKEGDGGNDDSLVVFTEIAHKRFLFTGDLESEGEKELLQAYPQLSIDILKAGHHGSKSSSSDSFIQQIQPEIAIISCGKNNRYHHPHDSVLEILAENKVQVYRTDQQGMLYYTWKAKQHQLTDIQVLKSSNE